MKMSNKKLVWYVLAGGSAAFLTTRALAALFIHKKQNELEDAVAKASENFEDALNDAVRMYQAENGDVIDITEARQNDTEEEDS